MRLPVFRGAREEVQPFSPHFLLVPIFNSSCGRERRQSASPHVAAGPAFFGKTVRFHDLIPYS